MFSVGFSPSAFSSTFTGALVSPAMKTGYLFGLVWGEGLLSRLRVVIETLSSMARSTGESMPLVFLLIGGASSSVAGVSWPSKALSDSSLLVGFELQAMSLAEHLPRLPPIM